MIEQLVILPDGEHDLGKAYEWYEDRDAGLGEEFLLRVEECFRLIRTVPEGFRTVRKDYRRALVRRFPYAIYYRFIHESVVIHAVLHNAQDPRKWRKRLR